MIVIAGATGLIGAEVARRLPRAILLARRPIAGRTGSWDVSDWTATIARLRPETLVLTLGTTMAKAGSEAAFRAVDQKLVLDLAQAARAAGTAHVIAVSAMGADPAARIFYSRVKGEVERDLSAMAFVRLDLLRPGLLIGDRANDRRAGERIGIALAPLTNALMRGRFRAYRAIPASTVAAAIVTLTGQRLAGRHIHTHDALMALARTPPSTPRG